MQPITFLDDVTVLGTSFARTEALRADQTAPAFSPFAFIDTDELGLSRLLGWLLDPRGSHAQGDRFLHALVTHLAIPWSRQACTAARVTLEAPTLRLKEFRRIDVLVVSDGRAIAVENKPFAADQPNQVRDYLTHLDQHHAHGGHLLYLSGRSAGPDVSSIAADEADRRKATGQLIVLGYPDLLPWLDLCRSACRAPRIGGFLADFQTWIRRRFSGEINVTVRDHLVADILSSPDRVGSAMQVIAAAGTLRGKLIQRLEDQLRNEASARGWPLLPETMRKVQWSGFRIRFGANDPFHFKLEFGDNDRASVSFGIWGIGPVHPDYAAMRDVLTSAFGRGYAHHASPWCRTPQPQDAPLAIEDNWFASDRPWIAIADGTLAPQIIAAAQSLHDALAVRGLIGRSSDHPAG